MKKHLIEQLEGMVAFLGEALGPDYEVTLYDLERKDMPLIAIANGRISGRTIGSPPPQRAIELLAESGRGYAVNFPAVLEESGKTVRTSVFRIDNDKGRAAALIGICFDDSRMMESFDGLMELVHPHDYLVENYGNSGGYGAFGRLGQAKQGGPLHNDVGSLMNEIFSSCAEGFGEKPHRLDQSERLALVSKLDSMGMFRLKGSVAYVAGKIGCSGASVYRYLNSVRGKKDNNTL